MTDLYSYLFKDFTPKQLEHSIFLFEDRHKRWELDLNWYRGKRCLDAGCGGGRYSIALASFGGDVFGFDLDKEAVSITKQRLKEKKLQATITHNNILDIPYPDNYFDFIICAGVAHHSGDTHGAFKELNRTLKKGGRMFFAVYGRGGLVWLVNDLMRYTVCKIIPFKVMNQCWKIVGVPANKRYNLLDNMYVKYCHRHTEKEVRKWFRECGYIDVKRFPSDYYDHTKLLPKILYGEGWLQFYVTK